MSPLLGISVPVAAHGLSMAETVTEVVEEVQRAETLGFDFVLIPEHHSGPPSTVRSILPLASHLLARTTRIAIGTGALLLPLHHPQHLLEFHQFATECYGPRFFLGVGMGYDPKDYALFGMAPEMARSLYRSRLDELAAALRDRPWTSGLAVAAWSRAGLGLAAASGGAWLADPIRPITDIAADAGAFRAGRPDGPSGGPVVLMREAWPELSQEQAREVYLPHLQKVLRYYERNSAGGSRPRDTTAPDWADPLALVTGEATLARRVQQIITATGAQALCLTLRQPTGPGHRAVLGAMSLLSRRLIRPPGGPPAAAEPAGGSRC
jgi:alkanesulfonate monooxygenase SsuD/methylene tetrahydromethanopterin reductase-like flavin-dependent oxidoreductase (luciferase family)